MIFDIGVVCVCVVYVGCTAIKYEIHIESTPLRFCYLETIKQLLSQLYQKHGNYEFLSKLNENKDELDPESLFDSIKASTSYFSPRPKKFKQSDISDEDSDSVNEGDEIDEFDELDDDLDEFTDDNDETKNENYENEYDDDDDDDENCDIERVLARGSMFFAKLPENACQIPANLENIDHVDNAGNSDRNESNSCDNDTCDNNGYVVFAKRGVCTFYDKARRLQNIDNSKINGVVIGNNNNGNIFTMGSDGTEKTLKKPTFMINSLSYNALEQCSANIENKQDKIIQLREILTRCEEQNEFELNLHGYNSHFYANTVSNSGFVVQQDGYVFLSIVFIHCKFTRQLFMIFFLLYNVFIGMYSDYQFRNNDYLSFIFLKRV